MKTGAGRWSLPVRRTVDLMTVREATRSAAAAAGFSLVSQTKLVTAVSELARTAVVHGGGGEVRIDAVTGGPVQGVRLVISDAGPGIPDIPRALADGHTTGHGLGLGLGGARRLVDEFSIESAPGQGTTVTIADHEYTASTLTLRPGSVLLFYTDGLIERRDAIIDAGIGQLAATFGAAPGGPEQIADSVCEVMLSDSSREDDTCLLVCRLALDRACTGEGGEPPSPVQAEPLT
jgi:serine/threonine-protein kinase RsbT